MASTGRKTTSKGGVSTSGEGPRRSPRQVFDHVAIAFAASERFHRTVLSLLGADPSHADVEVVNHNR